MSYFDKWQMVADDVICIIMAQHEAWIDAVDAGVQFADMPPGAWAAAYPKLLELRSDTKSPTRPLMDTELATLCGPTVTVEWVAERVALYDEYRAAAFAESCMKLTKYGELHRQLMTVRNGTKEIEAALNNGLLGDKAIARVIDGLQAESTRNTDEPSDLSALMIEHEARMNDDPIPGTPTGIHLLDAWIDGLSDNEFLALVAPYKSRKTSLTSVSLLAGLEQGLIIDYFSMDESRAYTINRLIAVLMAKWMFSNGHEEHPLNNVDAKMITRAGKRWRDWANPLPDAYQYAFDTLTGYGKQLRIYDGKKCDGSASSIRSIVRTDAAKIGHIDRVIFDHLQSMTGYKTIFEVVEMGSAVFHELRGELGCQVWLLAQQNESAIEFMGKSWSPKVKGGGGLASKADTIVISTYNQNEIEGKPDLLKLQLSQSRFGEGRLTGYVQIHPASGWVTPRSVEQNQVNLNDGF